MASLIDSEAVFAGRLKACGLDGYEAGFRVPSETHVDVPKLRKLYFEAYAMVAADLKAKLDSGPDADGQKLRRLAVVERKARWGEVPPYEFHRAVGARSPSDRQVPQHADGRGAPLYSTP